MEFVIGIISLLFGYFGTKAAKQVDDPARASVQFQLGIIIAGVGLLFLASGIMSEFN